MVDSSELPVWLTPAEVAEATHLSERTVQSLLSDGRLKSCKVGSARRVPLSELQRFERELLVGGEEQ